MSNFFDLLIAVLFVATALPAVILFYHQNQDQKSWEYRNKKLSSLIACLLLFSTAVIFWGSFIEPRRLTIRYESIDLEKVDKPIKIALLADMQVGPYKQEGYINKVVDQVLSLKPDMVFIAGDHINNSGNTVDETLYLRPLARLAKQIPIYAVPGNHEYGVSDNASLYDDKFRLPNLSEHVKKTMEGFGVKYLTNELVTIQANGQKFNLFGGDEYWAHRLNLSKLKTKDMGLSTVVLIHNPSAIFDLVDHDVDLLLSGHTHGGQIRLPFIGPIIRVSFDIPRNWHWGWINYRGLKAFVTSGVGETGVRARLFCPPEIVVMTIH